MVEVVYYGIICGGAWLAIAALWSIGPALLSCTGCVAMANAAAKLSHVPSTDINNRSLLFCVGVCVVAGVATWFLLQQAPTRFRRAILWA